MNRPLRPAPGLDPARARIVPEATQRNQRTASDPTASAWVSANAGSGKTTVLTRRVVRLLLEGVPPAKVLCLTFTKAAAANMQTRIFRQLGEWTVMPDEDLAAQLHALDDAWPEPGRLARARRLFADAVETPGGLKVLTLHAFCERVLHLFPFEANVPASFAVLDDGGVADLLERARRSVILDAQAQPSAPLGLAMARVIEEAADDAFDTLLREVTHRREALRALLRRARTPDGATARLREALAIAEHETVETLDALLHEGMIPDHEWHAIAATLKRAGIATDNKCGECLLRAHPLAGPARRAAYLEAFLTKEGNPKADTYLTKGLRKAEPDLADRLDAERARIVAHLARERAAACVERSHALLVVADAILSRYEAAKRSRAGLDFDDLIQSTLKLLRRAGADWVLYKLDQGIDHVLVDEAQDTSAVQWEIVERLTEEFTAGNGARERLGLDRTLFAVGDDKQSIFSFQGAAPEAFDRMKHAFQRRFEGAGLRFEPVTLQHSFRSTRDVLDAVDHVFAHEGNRTGLSADAAATHHETVRGEEPGRVEIWPLEVPAPDPEGDAWDAPLDTVSAGSPAVRLARRLARTVRTLTGPGCPDTGLVYRPGEVMVLVRSRNALFDAVIRSLKREGVPVAGADRLVLMDHIAVMDLVALGRFVLLPADDLTLATVLKSPLLGLDDEHLMRLAPGRSGSLWSALADLAPDEPVFERARARLASWLDEAAFKTPFLFFADVLGRDGGRRALLARLGHEAADALDEFLRAALDHEHRATPSLEGFLAWLAAAELEVKRDMDVARGEVRVMTVHGAKGLEARLVILADTCSAPGSRHDPSLFALAEPGTPDGAAPLLAWSPGARHDPPHTTAAREQARAEAAAEHRRLLYVALTRAEERLIIAGHTGKQKRPADSWYDMIETTLRAAGARPEPMPDGTGERLVWERTAAAMAQRTEAAPVAPAAEEPEPDWLRRAPEPEPERPVPLRPSQAVEADEAPTPGQPGVPPEVAATTGSLMHRLLQSLPDLPEVERTLAAWRLLSAVDGPVEFAIDPDTLVAEALAVLAAPALAPLFAPGSHAEVPLAGRLVRPGRPDYLVSGRVDRLAVAPEAVWLADFKTTREVPADAAAVPAATLRQLAVYRTLLTRLYPDRPVRALLVHTLGPSAMELPGEVLDAEVERLTVA